MLSLVGRRTLNSKCPGCVTGCLASKNCIRGREHDRQDTRLIGRIDPIVPLFYISRFVSSEVMND